MSEPQRIEPELEVVRASLQALHQQTPLDLDNFPALANFLDPKEADEEKPKLFKLYVAGPMTGIDDFNYPAFHSAADQLRRSDYEVLNPADIKTDEVQEWSWYMKRAIAKLVQCDGLALLDGWETSQGAILEVNLAHNLGLEIRHFVAWLTA
jgi:hypothetical protein